MRLIRRRAWSLEELPREHHVVACRRDVQSANDFCRYDQKREQQRQVGLCAEDALVLRYFWGEFSFADPDTPSSPTFIPSVLVERRMTACF